MSRLPAHYWPAGLFALLLGPACGSESDEQKAITSTPAAYCQTTCARAHDCNDAIDAAECRSSCQAELAAQPQLRPDFLGYVAGCVENAICSSTSTIAKCENEARARLASSKFGAAFCTAFVETGSECDPTGTKYPEASCLEAAKTYEDSALATAQACLRQSCAALDACLAAAIPDASP